MESYELAIKVDVDTERGTRIGVSNLLCLFKTLDIKATFLFSLGPDNTGRAIRRIFRPGFFTKVSRTSVLKVYGIRTLMNGVFWPGPHIGQKHASLMRQTENQGHEVGIHCYDHVHWQDRLHTMSQEQVDREVNKACAEFKRIFGHPALTAGAAGWQANEKSLQSYDAANFLYGSDARGTHAFFPKIKDRIFKTLQIPTTLPTLDELIGRPDYPEQALCDYYLTLIKPHQLNVLTVHAELEGMAYLSWFSKFLKTLKNQNIHFVLLKDLAGRYLKNKKAIPISELTAGTIDGRSGTLAVQKAS